MVSNISNILRKMNFVITYAPYELPPVACPVKDDCDKRQLQSAPGGCRALPAMQRTALAALA
jgi:hypothetical protein